MKKTTIGLCSLLIGLTGCNVDTARVAANDGPGGGGAISAGSGGTSAGGADSSTGGLLDSVGGSVDSAGGYMEAGGASGSRDPNPDGFGGGGGIGNVGSGGAGLGGSGGSSGGAVSAPKAADVCHSAKAALCKKYYTPGCVPADFLLELKMQYGPTEADCVAFYADKCMKFDCSLSDSYSPTNNQKCLDQMAKATCEDVTNGDTPVACDYICDE